MRQPFLLSSEKIRFQHLRQRLGEHPITVTVLAIAVWFFAYTYLEAGTSWLAYTVLHLSQTSAFGTAGAFFLYEVPKVLMLLGMVVFGVGVLRSFFTAERTRRLLAGRRETPGNVLAALLGTVTPFCSCSAVPLFIGFVTAGVPLGVTFSSEKVPPLCLSRRSPCLSNGLEFNLIA